MKALELNTEDPAFQDGWAVTVIETATIARLKMFRPKQAAQAVKQFTDIANLFNSISSALETVEIEWIKMNAEPEPYSFLSFAPQWFFAPQSTSSSSSKTKTNKAMTEVELYQSQGHVVPFEVRKDLAYFDPFVAEQSQSQQLQSQQSQTEQTEQQQIENTSWLEFFEKIAPVFNGLLSVYMSKAEKIVALQLHSKTNSVRTIWRDMSKVRQRIDQFASSFEHLLQLYSKDDRLRESFLQRVHFSLSHLNADEIFQQQEVALRLLREFRVLVPDYEDLVAAANMKAEREASIRTYRERLEDQAQQIEKGKEERRQRYVPKKLSEAKVEEDSEAKEEIIEVQIDYPSLTPDSDDVFIATAPVGLGGAEAQTQADIAPVANGGGIVAIAGIAGIAGLLLLTR